MKKTRQNGLVILLFLCLQINEESDPIFTILAHRSGSKYCTDDYLNLNFVYKIIIKVFTAKQITTPKKHKELLNFDF